MRYQMHLAHGLPFFHALTGCDTVSAFRGESKRKAWEIFDDATDTFVPLSEIPSAIGDQDIECIEILCSHHVRQDYDNVCREQSTFWNVFPEARPMWYHSTNQGSIARTYILKRATHQGGHALYTRHTYPRNGSGKLEQRNIGHQTGQYFGDCSVFPNENAKKKVFQ